NSSASRNPTSPTKERNPVHRDLMFLSRTTQSRNLQDTKTNKTIRYFLTAAWCCLSSPLLLAQVGQQPAQPQSTQASQLPLSGRTSQTGSVTTAQSPVPGTTTSVNTINPTVQIQGPFAGSALSTSRLPFTGRLSFREAIERGTDFNLGAIGLTQAV